MIVVCSWASSIDRQSYGTFEPHAQSNWSVHILHERLYEHIQIFQLFDWFRAFSTSKSIFF